MPIFKFKNYIPQIDSTCFIAPGAMVIGEVTLKLNSNIWHNSVLRADVNSIEIGENTNIQDLSMLHVTEKSSLKIGNNVSVGHSVTLHGCTIDNYCLIGMGATILDNVHIESECIVAAGSVLPPNKHFPKGSMIMGAPAKVVRSLTEDEIIFVKNHYKSYLKYKDEFTHHCIEIKD